MGAVHDDLPDHEGYAVRPRPDPTLTTASPDHTARSMGWVAACSCGWRDRRAYSADESGYQAAVDRWDSHHAAPMLERTVPADVADLVEHTRRAVARLAETRPRAASALLDSIDQWSAAIRKRTVARDVASPTVQQRLGALASGTRGGRPSPGR